MNERTIEKMREITPVKPEKKKDSDGKNESPNRGKLIIDATCAPADITYPTDLGLLNKARVHTEKILDILFTDSYCYHFFGNEPMLPGGPRFFVCFSVYLETEHLFLG